MITALSRVINHSGSIDSVKIMFPVFFCNYRFLRIRFRRYRFQYDYTFTYGFQFFRRTFIGPVFIPAGTSGNEKCQKKQKNCCFFV